jgi:aspartate/tyrosine/aromatic aminotransferase
MLSKQELIAYLENKLLKPLEDKQEREIAQRIRATRIMLNTRLSSEQVADYFWKVMAEEKGLDSYANVSLPDMSFAELRKEFKILCKKS